MLPQATELPEKRSGAPTTTYCINVFFVFGRPPRLQFYGILIFSSVDKRYQCCEQCT